MHVVHYIEHLRENEGGVVRSVLDITRVLAAHGCRITIVTGDFGGEASAGAESPVALLRLRLPTGPLPLLSKDNRAQVDHVLSNANVLHLHTLWDPRNLLMARTAKRSRTPYVVSTHGMLDDYAVAQKALKKQLHLALTGRRFLHAAARLHCSASHERLQVLRRAPAARVFVAPLAFDFTSYTTLPGPDFARSRLEILQQSGPKVLFLSRLDPIKGPDLLIRAIALLKHRPELRVIFAGPGDESYLAVLRSMAHAQGLTGRTAFVGMVNGELKRSLYQACDLFVLPTMQENFGMVFAEALACELPIVTTETVDTADELRGAGVTLVERSPEAFAVAIDRATSDVKSLKELGRQGRRYVLNWLDPVVVADQYKTMYREAIQQP